MIKVLVHILVRWIRQCSCFDRFTLYHNLYLATWIVFVTILISMKIKTLLQNLLFTLGFGGILLLSFLLTPDPRGYGTHEHLFLPPCYIRFFFNIPCPACGLTTCFALLAKGHWREAFQLHWMSPFLFITFVFLFIYSLGCLFTQKAFWKLFENKFTPYASSVIILGLMICWFVKLLANDSHSFAVRFF